MSTPRADALAAERLEQERKRRVEHFMTEKLNEQMGTPRRFFKVHFRPMRVLDHWDDKILGKTSEGT